MGHGCVLTWGAAWRGSSAIPSNPQLSQQCGMNPCHPRRLVISTIPRQCLGVIPQTTFLVFSPVARSVGYARSAMAAWEDCFATPSAPHPQYCTMSQCHPRASDLSVKWFTWFKYSGSNTTHTRNTLHTPFAAPLVRSERPFNERVH